ncbi:TRIC cation channel family protein [Cyanobium sp. FGCU-52]|nr:TRIC cation channel family protein [Cyanobium sp. FGCU52]
MTMHDMSQIAAVAGTVAFAATAVLAMAPFRVDLLTALVMGLMTAIGGGTIRDLILRQDVFWATDLFYIWVSLLASTVAFVAYRLISRRKIQNVLLYLDAVGIALFAIQGTAIAWMLGFGLPLAPIILGIITAIGGGLIRDVLAGRDNLLMKRELRHSGQPWLPGLCSVDVNNISPAESRFFDLYGLDFWFPSQCHSLAAQGSRLVQIAGRH